MNDGVPIVCPVCVAPLSVPFTASRRLAMPKSSTLMLASFVRNTFSGLMSRWTIPLACAAASTSSSWNIAASTSSTPSRPLRRTRWSSVSPSRRSIVKNGAPSSVTSSSMTLTAPLCATALATYPSRVNRARDSSLMATSRWRILMATRFPFRCVAA